MAHLARMDWLRGFAPEVGWSDHTLVAKDGIKAAKVALMLGADYIERHFTILPADKTKDGPISITPALLKELSIFSKLTKNEQRAIVEAEIPEWRKMLGQRSREMTHTEMLNRDYYRGRFASKKYIYNWEE
jgi:N,N'-diacetyllegionaminate synthase